MGIRLESQEGVSTTLDYEINSIFMQFGQLSI